MSKKPVSIVTFMLIILALSSILLVACSRNSSTANSSNGNTPAASQGGSKSNTVEMDSANFAAPSITIAKGSKLTLVDTVAVPHVIQNGSWENGAAKPAKEAGAPTVDQSFAGSDTQSVGPFTTAGTFMLYCTIHQNMNLKVIVQ